jgi:general secretion pathway protein D
MIRRNPERMRRAVIIGAIALMSSVALAAADSAKTLYNKGVDAEARQDYEAAYAFYKQAYDLKPTDIKYRVPFERTRFLAAASKVHRGQKLREQGKLVEALVLFEQAASIDPSNDLAAQEVRRTQQMVQKQAGGGQAAAPSPPKGDDDALRKRLEAARSPVMLNDISNAPLSALEMTADTKSIYETIGKLAGLNILFDPEYQPRTLPIKLKNVTLQEALDIVALESRTFWRPVTPNTIFVAADTQTKRRELEQNVIKTFYLGNVSSPTDLQDIVNAIRTVLEVQRILQVPSQNAIIVKGTPDQLALAQKMVDDIDKPRPEVIVDVWVAQVRRDKLRDLGIIPPENAVVTIQGQGVTTTPTTTGTGTTTTTTTNPLTFDSLQHLNLSSWAVQIDPIKATALFSDNSSKILQSPRIRATDNEKATLKIGDKIPIATGSFGTPVGIGTATGAVGVNTQFTYTEVGVTLDITPHVHSDGQVTLKTTMEISNVTGQSSISGVSQPIISQRRVEQTIRLNDGEINLMGGILERTETLTTEGWPFLSSIPIFKYLFSRESKEKITNELVFLLVPHIVRAQELSDLNRRSLDIGTGATPDLRIAARPAARTDNAVASASSGAAPQPAAFVPAPTVARPAAVQPAAVSPAQPPPPAATDAPVQPATTSPSGATAPSPGSNQISLRLDPGTLAPGQGSSFALNVVLANGQDISTVPVEISYDPKVMEFQSVTPGDFLNRDGQPVTLVHRDDPPGRLVINAQRPPGSAGVSGNGTVYRLTFTAKAKGGGVVSVATPGARNSQNQQLTIQGAQATVTVN